MQNTDKIENFCTDQGISLMGRIPFDSDAVKAINNGQTIVDIVCASGAEVKAIYSKTMELLFEEGGGLRS
jgi:MinD superfamily P-loop ATPase